MKIPKFTATKLSDPAGIMAACISFMRPKPARVARIKRSYPAPVGSVRLSVNIDEGLHKQLKVFAVKYDTTLTEVINTLIAGHLVGESNHDTQSPEVHQVALSENHAATETHATGDLRVIQKLLRSEGVSHLPKLLDPYETR